LFNSVQFLNFLAAAFVGVIKVVVMAKDRSTTINLLKITHSSFLNYV
jgi:3-dehydroquinate dehydratase